MTAAMTAAHSQPPICRLVTVTYSAAGPPTLAAQVDALSDRPSVPSASRMTGYTYSVSLRFRHPACSPDEITEALDIEPSRSWLVGAPRRTPKGSPLQGTYRDTYWYALLVEGSSEERDLPRALATILDRLGDRTAFFLDFARTGGRAELFIGWFSHGNSGDVLGRELLGRLSELKLDLALDIYPGPHNNDA